MLRGLGGLGILLEYSVSTCFSSWRLDGMCANPFFYSHSVVIYELFPCLRGTSWISLRCVVVVVAGFEIPLIIANEVLDET